MSGTASRIFGLDLMRFIAIMLVLISHARVFVVDLLPGIGEMRVFGYFGLNMPVRYILVYLRDTYNLNNHINSLVLTFLFFSLSIALSSLLYKYVELYLYRCVIGQPKEMRFIY